MALAKFKNLIPGSGIEGLVANAAFSQGDLAYLLSTGKWAKAQCNAQDKNAIVVVDRDISAEDITAGGERAKFTGLFMVEMTAAATRTPGVSLYTSTSVAGAVQATIPGTAGNILQKVGWAKDASTDIIDLRGPTHGLTIQSAGNSNIGST